MHDALTPRFDTKRPILRVLALRCRRINHKSAIEAFGCAELFIRDLMAHRASHAIFGFSIRLVVRIKWKMRKNLSLAALQPRQKARNGHMANRAFVLYRSHRFWMIDRLAPHASLPIGIARRIRHNAGTPIEPDGNILTRRRHDSILTSQAAVRSLKAHLCVSVLPATPDQSGR